MYKVPAVEIVMTKLGTKSLDLLIPNEDTRVYREALALIKAGYEVTVFCWSRRLWE